MTLVELKELIRELGLNDNAKVCLLIGRTSAGAYEVVQVDADGKLVTTS